MAAAQEAFNNRDVRGQIFKQLRIIRQQEIEAEATLVFEDKFCDISVSVYPSSQLALITTQFEFSKLPNVKKTEDDIELNMVASFKLYQSPLPQVGLDVCRLHMCFSDTWASNGGFHFSLMDDQEFGAPPLCPSKLEDEDYIQETYFPFMKKFWCENFKCIKQELKSIKNCKGCERVIKHEHDLCADCILAKP